MAVRLRSLRLWPLRMRLERLRGLRRLWWVRRLLPFLGTLRPLLRAAQSQPSKEKICYGRVLLDPANVCLLIVPTGRTRISAYRG